MRYIPYFPCSLFLVEPADEDAWTVWTTAGQARVGGWRAVM
jgi:hypothetical protein